MTRNEVQKIMAILEVSYPNWLSKLDDEKIKVMINLWTELFADDNADVIASAIKKIISSDTSPFPPTIARIKEVSYELLHPNEMSEQEAWNLVYKAICNSGYNAKEEFDKLPYIIQKMTSVAQLRDYSQMDSDQVNSFISIQFMKGFKERQREHKQHEMLPDNLKNIGVHLKSIE